jgi:hypothetical protein
MIVKNNYRSFIFHLRPSKWNFGAGSLYNSLTASHNKGATIIALTEVADGKRPEALNRWCDKNGWANLQDTLPWQKGETAILYDWSYWQLVEWETVQIGPDLGPGLPVVATLAVLINKDTNEVFLFGVSHLPSAVEAIWNVKGAKRVLAYRRMVVKYRQAAAHLRKKHRPDVEALSADWNINLLKVWARNFLKSAFPKHKLVTQGKHGNTNTEPTHGDRKIDGWLLKGAKGNIDVISAALASDHMCTELTISRIL